MRSLFLKHPRWWDKVKKCDRLGKFGFIEINTSASTYKELINERPDFVWALQSLNRILNAF